MNRLIYAFVLVIVSVIVGYLLFGSGYNFDKHRLEGKKSLEKERAPMEEKFTFPMKVETPVKGGFLSMEFNVALSTEKAMKEIEKKYQRIIYGIKLVLREYKPEQIHRRKLERSTLKKIIQSQIRGKVKKVEIISFKKS